MLSRLLLLGRDAPVSLGPLRRDFTAAWLGTSDLAMTSEEVAVLWRDGFGLPMSTSEADRLRSVTDGWTAAVVLAASRAQLARDGRTARAGARGRGPDRPDADGQLLPAQAASSAHVLSNLVDEILAGLPRRAQIAVVQAAHLPLLSETIAQRGTGVRALLAMVSPAGLPLQDRGDGWFQLIGPVQDLLAARAPARQFVLAAAAAAYAGSGHSDLAAESLIGAGRPGDAAALLAAMSPQDAERMGLPELSGLVDRLPPHAVVAHPRVLLHLARECEPPAAIHRRTQALNRALELLGQPPADPVLAREIHAELARDLVRDDDPDGAEALATAVLAQTGPGEERTQARLLEALGRAAARYKDEQHLAFAADRLAMAARSYRSQGLWSWLAYTLATLGYWVHSDRGATEQALAAVDEALEVIPDRRQQRAVILTFRGEILHQPVSGAVARACRRRRPGHPAAHRRAPRGRGIHRDPGCKRPDSAGTRS